MANMTEIRRGLAARLATVDLRTPEDGVAPGQVTPESGKAVAVVVPSPGTCIVRDTQGLGGYALTLVVKLLVGASLTPAAQKALDAYLDTDSDRSVIAAIEDPTLPLGGGADFASFVACQNYGQTEYAGVVYPASVEIIVAVGAM
jgi:hypothetical protein